MKSFKQRMFSLTDLPLKGKTVLVRMDYNVPLKGTKILDNTKIKLSLPTLNYLLKQKCKIIIATHLGRPNGKIDSKLTLNQIAKELRKLSITISKLNDSIGPEIKDKINRGKLKQLFLLENLRFYQEELQNDYAFAHSLANLADFYVNDAFSVSHRKHASVSAITKFIPSGTGFLLEKEISQLTKVLKPQKPLTWIIGGAKLDKLDLIEKALKKSNYILVGGALAFSFLKAQGFQVGMSKTDVTSVKLAKKILKKRLSKKIILPIDATIAANSKAQSSVVSINQIPTNQIGFDIGPQTVRLFKEFLKKSKTIMWNGPLGYFEVKPFDKSSINLAKFISKSKAVKIIAGGESSEMINSLKLNQKMTYVSVGGGASLDFLSQNKLPGIIALEKNYRRIKKRFD